VSWHYSRALVAEYSEATCSAGAQSALSSGNPTPQAFLSPDRMTAFSRLSRFGMTCKPLMEPLGADLLMWFREDFLAKTYPQPEKAQESTEHEAECGRTWHESFATWDRDSSSWKTPQCSLLAGLDEFSETWPRWGIMQNGECSQEPMLDHDTCGKGSGLSLPTIGKNEFRGTSRNRYKGSPHFRGAKMCEGLRTCETDPTYLAPDFSESVMGFPATWTELAPLEMHRFRDWQLTHSEPLTKIK